MIGDQCPIGRIHTVCGSSALIARFPSLRNDDVGASGNGRSSLVCATDRHEHDRSRIARLTDDASPRDATPARHLSCFLDSTTTGLRHSQVVATLKSPRG